MAQTDVKNGSLKDYNGDATTPEITDLHSIRHDIEALKENVLSLTKHLQRDGKAKASEVSSALNEGLEAFLSKGDQGLSALENQVKENPRRALVLAFLAGFAANLLIRKG